MSQFSFHQLYASTFSPLISMLHCRKGECCACASFFAQHMLKRCIFRGHNLIIFSKFTLSLNNWIRNRRPVCWLFNFFCSCKNTLPSYSPSYLVQASSPDYITIYKTIITKILQLSVTNRVTCWVLLHTCHAGKRKCCTAGMIPIVLQPCMLWLSATPRNVIWSNNFGNSSFCFLLLKSF